MIDNKIKFIEESHQYINTLTNEEYIPVSSFLGLFKDKFDSDKMSKIIAKKRNTTQKAILAEWENTKNFACERGTACHLAMENYIKFGEVDPEYKKIIENFQACVDKNIFNIKNIFSEMLCYNDKYKIAGTSDICWEHEDDTFTIGDFKTNKRFRFYSEYNNWLKPPVNHLMECEFNNYTLQLSLYALMYELLTNKKCKGLLLLWLDQNTGKWVPIRCNYLKHEIIMMLNKYNSSKTK